MEGACEADVSVGDRDIRRFGKFVVGIVVLLSPFPSSGLIVVSLLECYKPSFRSSILMFRGVCGGGRDSNNLGRMRILLSGEASGERVTNFAV